MDKESIFLRTAEAALDRAKKLGAHLAEVYISSTKELNIEVRDGRVETMKLAEDRGLGIRVIQNGRIGFSFSTDLSPRGVEDAARKALDNCGKASEDPFNRLPPPGTDYPALDIYDPAIREATVEQKIEMARYMEETARSYDPRVKIIESSTYQDGEVLVCVINSLGMQLSYRSAYCGIYLALAAGEGDDSQTGFALDFKLKYDQLKPEKVGREAARRAVRMLGAAPVTTRRVAVVLDPFVATGFLGLLGPALTGEAVQKGRSLFARKVGERVASDKITITDDGAMPGGIASAPFDGEGVPTSRTVLIEKGILKGYLHNTYTASREGVRSTGNGVRSSFKGTPEVGVTNFFIEPGQVPPEALIRELPDGLYITEVMGMHTANPISGDFSVGVAGLLIENGELTRPVRGMAMGGNIMDFLAGIDAVGNDLQFFGGRGAPTLRVAGMTVSGQ
ncbi:predicted Zn-dependent protease and their inactivated homologs [Pelotomaculum thermopropionicum SI]|uniref:Predicted Zn-dependent protease and their inactivated homologs n=1 Tax=Pelotomaculum thermopropionicum (strain DSM 13744 / JCM 10971 / SI) TaxID=370438 RepID=A5D336_PELTS|nr:predicted Zn-dependent protease and their inactivated homologs [Pelotomaculum thermopropionicum SI]